MIVLYPEERQQAVVARARAAGRVDVASLVEEFGVTAETVRRDLGVLERHGVLRRVHGGAIPVERLSNEAAVGTREAEMPQEKERIARAAVAEIGDATSVLLDAGTTTARMVEFLPSERELTVVTNSPPIAVALAARPNVVTHVVGGRIRSRTLAAVDQEAVRALADLYVDVAFIATNGLSVRRGLTTADTAEAAVKRAMIAAGRRRVLLADHTKIGTEQFTRFATLDDVDLFITDRDAHADAVAELRSAGLQVELV